MPVETGCIPGYSHDRSKWKETMTTKRKNAGFTLVELMVVIALIAITAAVAVPGFRGLIEANRQTSAANSVIGILNFARSEAVRRGEPVQVLPVGGAYNNGLRVVLASDVNTVIRRIEPMPGSVTLSRTGGVDPTFSGNGMKQNGASTVYQVCPGNGEAGVSVVVNAGGQTSRDQVAPACS
jgi:type IV fimbrial biogenesis protein FimT